ncbi:MAG TPA: amylo-alpha-1,6-glucosidase [Bryobacteraceae bacterium]|jgi:predicted glycogen debranching enzyme|nr:amylo-alpha-1,6-glucosidase [Bryobacteraceae bacterium]
MSEIRFDRSICGDAAESFRREWLETNGLGGFASSTIAGANTRRYHGLLIAATQPPAVRCLLLSKLEETLIVGDRRFDLSTNLYPGCVHPEGYRYLSGFRMDPFPIFVFEAGGVTIEKRVCMVHGENTVVVEYEVSGGSPDCRLELRPLIAFRGYHDLTHENSALNGDLKQTAGSFSIQPYPGLPELHVAHNARSLKRRGHWYFHFEYPVERDRGLDYQEDLFCPCVLEFDLVANQPAVVIASTAMHQADESARLKTAEIERRDNTSGLAAAADQFLVRRGPLHTIIAGYPWFTDWARDTMIALPGLTLVSGKFDIAKDILLAFAGCLDQGMLPNKFPDAQGVADDKPEYNTADATLWFFEAVREYLEYSKDAEFVRVRLYESLKGIIEWHVKGTRFGIHVDTDGLLAAGDPTTQLTWMDARVGGRPVTPRSGKPVEVQALWYNAVRFAARLANDVDDQQARMSYEDLAAKIAKNFNASFWNEDAGCLYDVIDGDCGDSSLRPNQLIALSLGYCAIPEARARRILATVEGALLTPFGLRTLAPSAPAYRGRYEGGVAERDAAYHQGTVWPWLLGPFIAADLRFNGEAARQRVPELLAPLLDFARTRGTGHIPEIFDGDPPHEPRGCFSQAWSVAEILRISSISA